MATSLGSLHSLFLKKYCLEQLVLDLLLILYLFMKADDGLA